MLPCACFRRLTGLPACAQTCVRGLRAELLRPSSPRTLVALALLAAITIALPRVAAGLASLLCVAIGVLPYKVAHDYIQKSIKDDMGDPVRRYVGRAGSNFWVAVEDSTGELLGTVAVEAPAGGGYWKAGDAELRRMSVARSARGCGVAGALIRQVHAFASSNGYHRVVLSTSTLQGVACFRLYPRLGFSRVHVTTLFGAIEEHFFALPVGGSPCVNPEIVGTAGKPPPPPPPPPPNRARGRFVAFRRVTRS